MPCDKECDCKVKLYNVPIKERLICSPGVIKNTCTSKLGNIKKCVAKIRKGPCKICTVQLVFHQEEWVL